MKRYFLVGIGLLTGGLLGAGCGDDGDDGGAGNGTGNGGQNVECTPGAGGACQNDTDCPKVETGEVRTTAQTCGRGCQQDPDPAACAVGCIVSGAEVTMPCAACYAALVGCASQNCLAECGADPASDACNQCQVSSGCRGTFDSCSGLMSTN